MNFCLPATSIRVWLNTNKDINDDILQTVIKNIKYYSGKSKDEIIKRMLALDEEWDTDRVIETSSAALILTGVLLTLCSKNKNWSILSGLGGAFLMQYALQGWCPPLSCARRLGIRTQTEIMTEKALLEILKEDPQLIDEDRIKDIVTSII